MRLIDISRGLSPATAVWPGDQTFEWTWTTRLKEGGSVNLGSITLSTHTGSHVDAPLHTRSDGANTSALELESFVGAAEVVDVREADTIRPSHVPNNPPARVLFKTSASTLSKTEWPTRIAPIAPATVEVLTERNVDLIGTDAPSVDPLDSTTLPAHHALIEAGILNIEGLVLADVSPGRYSLLALPLKLEKADAAPVRAVLGEVSLLG
ncbi:kynurenine formamidase [Salinibacter sp. 10B]|uniref:cyclase family protein n=1 Tax=Salinibacter sp. 10B TaxID=1923971 RepID=UPI000CF4D6F3|nr:cyclase family protein [Salinibacter sp. 10B]PQJ33477.1 kynurenine formamidase [Salinibacter sp. 10B]